MKNMLIISLLTVLLSVNAIQVHAATVEVTYTEPNKFSDMRPGERHRHAFQEEVFYNVNKHLTKLAKKLPEDQTLTIEFIDIDLAGDIRFTGGQLFRVVSNIYSPRLQFNYQLTDKNKHIIKSGEENIRDTSFMMHQRLRYKNEAFGYEKKVLDEWFKDTFLDKSAPK